MSRKSPSSDTLKILYVRSGNVCAYDNCFHPIFDDNGLYVAELCHIKAANEGGPRFDINQTDEQRREPDNLLFMCHRHHKVVDSLDEYTVEKLTTIKMIHEAHYTEGGRTATLNMLDQIKAETTSFWEKQDRKEFEFQEFKIERDSKIGIFDLFDELEERIQFIHDYCEQCAHNDRGSVIRQDLNKLFNKIGVDPSLIDKIDYRDNPFLGRMWEVHNLARPNTFSLLSLCVKQLKVKVIEELIKNSPHDNSLKNIADQWRKDYEQFYDNSYYLD